MEATDMRVEEQPIEPRDLVATHLYPDEAAVIQDALRHLLQDRPDLRIAWAIHRYQTEDMTVARAAQLAGVSFFRMKDLMFERGVTPRLGPATLEEARQEVEEIEQWFSSNTD
jgi:predicted HTH domain antitoxin